MKRQLPVLDLKSYQNSSTRAQFVANLSSACTEIGFFLLQHEDFLPPSLLKGALDETRRFFLDATEDEKAVISYDKSSAFRGYMKLGVENTNGRVDHREQIEYATDYPPPMTSGRPATLAERLMSTNPWPPSHPTLENAVMKYVDRLNQAARLLRQALCEALDLAPTTAGSLFDTPHWALKLVHYPPSCTSGGEELGVGAHTDTNFVTFILQDGTSGLQVRDLDGTWMNVECDPNMLVCNLGELSEMMSSGRFVATPSTSLGMMSFCSPKGTMAIPVTTCC